MNKKIKDNYKLNSIFIFILIIVIKINNCGYYPCSEEVVL